MMRVMVTVDDLLYNRIEYKSGDILDMPDNHATPLKLLGKVKDAGDDEQPRSKTRYKTRHLRAEE